MSDDVDDGDDDERGSDTVCIVAFTHITLLFMYHIFFLFTSVLASH